MVKALRQETVSDSNDLAYVRTRIHLNEDITVRLFSDGTLDIYNYTDDTGVVLRPEEVGILQHLLEGNLG